jgi:hypothetical protein
MPPISARIRDIPPIIITLTPAIPAITAPAIKSPVGGLDWSHTMIPVKAAAE